MRESLCYWLLMIASLIWDWDDYTGSTAEYYSYSFFRSLEPKWEYYEDTESFEIPF